MADTLNTTNTAEVKETKKLSIKNLSKKSKILIGVTTAVVTAAGVTAAILIKNRKNDCDEIVAVESAE